MSDGTERLGPHRFQQIQQQFGGPATQEQLKRAATGKAHHFSVSQGHLGNSSKVDSLAHNERSSPNFGSLPPPIARHSQPQSEVIELTASQEIAEHGYVEPENEETFQALQGLKDQLNLIKFKGSDRTRENKEAKRDIRNDLKNAVEDFARGSYSNAAEGLRDVQEGLKELAATYGPVSDPDTKLELRELADEVKQLEAVVEELGRVEDQAYLEPSQQVPVRTVSHQRNLSNDIDHIANKADDAAFNVFESIVSVFSSDKAKQLKRNRIESYITNLHDNWRTGDKENAAKNLLRLAKASPDLFKEQMEILESDKTGKPGRDSQGLTVFTKGSDVIAKARELSLSRLEKHANKGHTDKTDIYMKLLLTFGNDIEKEAVSNAVMGGVYGQNGKDALAKLLTDNNYNDHIIPHAKQLVEEGVTIQKNDFGDNQAEANAFMAKVLDNPDIDMETKRELLSKVPVSLIDDSTMEALLKDENGELKENALEIVSHFVSKEIENETGDALFRSKTIGSAMLSYYLKEEGGEWTGKILEGIQERLVESSASIENFFTAGTPDNVDSKIIEPAKKELKELLQEKGTLTKEEVKQYLANHPELKALLGEDTEAFVNKATMGLADEFKTPGDIDMLLSPAFTKQMKKFSFQGMGRTATNEILQRLEHAVSPNSDNPIPPNVLKLLQVVHQSGAKNARKERETLLKDQQVNTFRKFDVTTAMLRMINPSLTGQWGNNAWPKGSKTPQSVIQAGSVLQGIANRLPSTDKKNPELAQIRGRIEGKLQDKYDEMSPPTIVDRIERQTDWSLQGVHDNAELFNEMKEHFEKQATGEIFHFLDALDEARTKNPDELQAHYEAVIDKFLKAGGEEQINLQTRDYKKAAKFKEKLPELLAPPPESAEEINKQLQAIMTGAITFSTLWVGMANSFKNEKLQEAS